MPTRQRNDSAGTVQSLPGTSFPLAAPSRSERANAARGLAAPNVPLAQALKDTFHSSWHLGLTAFGGPPVHFQIFHKLYVEKLKWIDEQTYLELFAVVQATPGPGSTKMLAAIHMGKGGLPCALLALAFWCLPGAAGMFGLATGIANVGEILPSPVYALLTGLNSATVGVIALAAVQLSDKAITDKLTRTIVFFSASAGILYTALWYFPVLLAAGACASIVYDYGWVQRAWKRLRGSKKDEEAPETELQDLRHAGEQQPSVEHLSAKPSDPVTPSLDEPQKVYLRHSANAQAAPSNLAPEQVPQPVSPTASMASTREHGSTSAYKPVAPFSTRTAIIVLVAFIASFIAIVTLRGRLASPPRPFSIFANLYLAGTIIVGGGPVVIPLLSTSFPTAWVSQRDFLLGLALIQAFPGPNFNFAVYLGALAVQGTSTPMILGSLIAFLAIFSPGLIIIAGIQGIWHAIRTRRWIKSALRGLNATAVGFVYSAFYRLWQIGLIDRDYRGGRPLGTDPWWVVIVATAYVGGRFYNFPAFPSILLGGVLGLLWYAAIEA